LRGEKQGVRLVPMLTALQHRESGAAVYADTLAIGRSSSQRRAVWCCCSSSKTSACAGSPSARA